MTAGDGAFPGPAQHGQRVGSHDGKIAPRRTFRSRHLQRLTRVADRLVHLVHEGRAGSRVGPHDDGVVGRLSGGGFRAGGHLRGRMRCTLGGKGDPPGSIRGVTHDGCR